MSKRNSKFIFAFLCASICFVPSVFAKTLVYPLPEDSTLEKPYTFYCTAAKGEVSHHGDTKVFMTWVKRGAKLNNPISCTNASNYFRACSSR